MTDVLIIGAGPTGLALASELERRNVSVRIIDQKEGISVHSKALGIQSRTLEHFEKMGLAEEFLRRGLKVQNLTLHWKGQSVTLSLKDLDAPYPFILVHPQADTEEILHNHLKVKVEWKTRLLDIIEGKPLVERPNGEKEVIEAKWIVGCDGAHSLVRNKLNLSFKGYKFPENFLIADVKAETKRPDGPQVAINKMGVGVVLPLPKENTYRLILPVRTEEKDTSLENFSTLIKERDYPFPFEIKEMIWASQFQIHRRHVPALRRGHIFLVGDSAHIHSPVGGQGMNTCIQDAYNLAWKLALVIHGVAYDSILDTYEIERLPIAKMMLKATSKATRMMTFFQKHFARLLIWGLRFITKSKKRQLKFAMAMSELGISYTQSPIVYQAKRDEHWSGPKPGERAPDCRLADESRLFELYKSPKHVMLLFEEQGSFIEAIRREYGEWIDVHVIKDEELKKRYHAEPNSLYLIRPDGYVGYRSQQFKTEEVVAYLLRIFKPASQRKKS